MPPAARLGDPTGHPGSVVSGNPAVLIEGKPAAAAGDLHACTMPPLAGPHGVNPFVGGSGTVSIGGRPALRQGDKSGCGAPIVLGALSVVIGG